MKKLNFTVSKIDGKYRLFFDNYEDHFTAEKYINFISSNTVKITGKKIGINLLIIDMDKWSKNISNLIDDTKVKNPNKDKFSIVIK